MCGQATFTKTKVIIHKSRSDQFYETEIKIWPGFEPVGKFEKKIGTDYEQLLI